MFACFSFSKPNQKTKKNKRKGKQRIIEHINFLSVLLIYIALCACAAYNYIDTVPK